MRSIRSFKLWIGLALALASLLLALAGLANGSSQAAAAEADGPTILGPYVSEPVYPHVFNGDLRDLPQLEREEPLGPIPLRYTPGNAPKWSSLELAGWTDPIAQLTQGPGQMPDPIIDFAGLNFAANGSGWPPDTNGDVGPNHYVQTVNTSVGIYNKSTGAQLVAMTFDAFFTGPGGTPCDTSNDGDPVVLYDPLADRWIVTDFAWFNFNTGPFYECIAVSQGPNPVTDGWYFYAFRADTDTLPGYLNDYPKLGVWPDAWYMSANMFQIVAPGTGFAVRAWALDRASMLAGGPANDVHFDCLGAGCDSLLPSNLRGDLPPAGSPNYFAAVEQPDTLNLWEFHVDWGTPANSTFTGPTPLTIANFAQAQGVPQFGSGELLDSLSPRLMMQNQYRTVNGVESLWLNHTVASTGGIGGVRWYEVQDPGGAPALAQQGTYQPDEHHRWMGSIAADQDGNVAVGYSVSSSTMRPAIRYAGRQYGEAPGLLPQAEAVLIQGTGSQSGGFSRWGDYSAMTVDPVDDCTFWYTTEYYITTGNNWQTRIGAFRFPSCGQPKGWIEGTVRNSVTLEPIEGAIVVAESVSQTLSVQTDSSGYYTMTLLPNTFDVLATPLLPGYPVSSTVSVVTLAVGNTETADLFLDPVPYLVEDAVQLDDSGPNGNGNGYAEPGEQGILLWEGLLNAGALTATNVTANLVSLSSGLTIDTASAGYPDIAASEVMTNTTAFAFSVDETVICGDDLDFQKTVTSDEGSWTIDFTLNASIPLPTAEIFNNDVEGGAAGWTTGGTPNTWAITTEDWHSPTHSWTDSPGADYGNNVNNYVRTPAYNLAGQRGVRLSGWYKWELEPGYDFAYIEYSLNGGTTWNSTPLQVFNGIEDWTYVEVDASVLDNQSNVALRWRLDTDGSVIFDGIHIDDLVLTYEPYECTYVPQDMFFVYLPYIERE
ncbi:MAG: carboxypeptidase regulatory-like domain-containing protein [Chloroflexi bacterium]|nr:carboxypeptidase regulatory-like domain-containing protein [Chloroflexota bacterium]